MANQLAKSPLRGIFHNDSLLFGRHIVTNRERSSGSRQHCHVEFEKVLLVLCRAVIDGQPDASL